MLRKKKNPLMRPQVPSWGWAPWCVGVIGEPEVNEIIGKVRCELVTDGKGVGYFMGGGGLLFKTLACPPSLQLLIQ